MDRILAWSGGPAPAHHPLALAGGCRSSGKTRPRPGPMLASHRGQPSDEGSDR
jgi:hypothetical protein